MELDARLRAAGDPGARRSRRRLRQQSPTPSIDALPQGARVGTSSLRRQAQLRARRPDLQLLDLRGNVNTRLAQARCRRLRRDRARLRRPAAARLRRAHPRAPGRAGLAAGAGAGRDRDRDAATTTPRIAALCAALDDAATRTCVEAERAMNRALHGSCHVPVAAFARLRRRDLSLQGWSARPTMAASCARRARAPVRIPKRSASKSRGACWPAARRNSCPGRSDLEDRESPEPQHHPSEGWDRF